MRGPAHILLMMSIIALGSVVSAAPVAAAQITVEVRTIAASKNGAKFDEQLADLKAQLSKAFVGYTSFVQVDVTRVSVGEKQEGSLTLINGQQMTLTFYGLAGDLVTLGLNLVGKMNTTLRLSPGSTFFQAGLAYKDGILILAIKLVS